jgi:hypothetical protein
MSKEPDYAAIGKAQLKALIKSTEQYMNPEIRDKIAAKVFNKHFNKGRPSR